MYIKKKHISNTDIKNFLFSSKNREFLIFLFFLALSACYWLIITLNERAETDIRIPVQYVGVPGNVVMIGDTEDTLTVRVQDRRYSLCSYIYGDMITPIKVDFASCSSGNGVGLLSHAEILKQLGTILYGSTKVVGVKPEGVKFYYNYGERKRVPVKISGKVSAAGSYYLSRIKYNPDSVTVYALRDRLDSIKCVYTTPLNLTSINDTLFVKAKLQKIPGAKCVPSEVNVGFYTDIYIEESVEVPVKTINIPEGKVLRTFPSRVTVSFVVGVSVFRTLDLSQFEVVADYSEVEKTHSEKCNIYLKKVPHGVKRPSLKLKQVDYIIEEE